jgi:hypothetical protein
MVICRAGDTTRPADPGSAFEHYQASLHLTIAISILILPGLSREGQTMRGQFRRPSTKTVALAPVTDVARSQEIC